MLNQKTCESIWHCHREIEAATKLLSDIDELNKKNKESRAASSHKEALKDVFGYECGLELGVPSGVNSRRLFKVSLELAVPVIKAHIANKTARLTELNAIAKLELI